MLVELPIVCSTARHAFTAICSIMKSRTKVRIACRMQNGQMTVVSGIVGSLMAEDGSGNNWIMTIGHQKVFFKSL